ncbi:helix-turn-helix domain-containing protein [Salinibacterium sp. NSLL150]|uniref:helix-turn-helix domain-containing protein n=1 Tax=unclassified Salinibacterium TaxID=2632331 RepID=UPI0018CE4344|nr:helix-turn-helix domain-containing protein [Salinibacterium sp. NSLL35]MBH0102124.1 helix-turn-helix domain-containing protein [Salinibacterium sp. NSLL150]MBH0104884.1 helix-turn-helix domain-containing protein [Salinibacterium sp. NSLL16]MBH0107644.1 helix-turn-helix domain-containing protein [Salinibacterium sp. NSLL17]
MATHTEPPRDPDWITIVEAAELLRCSTKTIRRMIYDGDIYAVRIGKRMIRIRASSLREIGEPMAWRDPQQD